MTIEEANDFPGLYKSADKASAQFQSKHYSSHLWHLIALILAAVISSYFSNTTFGAIASALLFLVSLLLIIYQKVSDNEALWYNGRAVAESIKTRAWRWMMCAEPYVHTLSMAKANEIFLEDLKEILQKNMKIASEIPIGCADFEAISDVMKRVRSLPIEDRLNLYRTNRVEGQADWYRSKAKLNKDKSKIWFGIAVLLHSGAIICLLCKISEPSNTFPIGILATMASATMSWVQSKKFNELSASYSLTSHEIILINGECTSIEDEDSLSNHIINTESAFSREHTQWIARKSK